MPAEPIGETTPTGVYYQYADFQASEGGFVGGYDVDSYGERLYVSNYQTVDVYEVALLDSDGDGLMEPNQHPDNPEEPGAIEQRLITYIETLPTFGTPALSSSELLALEDRIFIGGSALNENVFGGAITQITGETFPTAPDFQSSEAGWFLEPVENPTDER